VTLTGILLAVAGLASASSTTTISGDPTGVRLARTVDAAYARVPAVESTGAFTLEGDRRVFGVRVITVLNNGSVATEHMQFYLNKRLVTEQVHRPEGLYQRDAGSRCWTFKPGKQGKSIGNAYFTTSGSRYSRPGQRPHGSITMTSWNSREGTVTRVAIDPRTKRVVAADVKGKEARMVFGDRTLTAAPALPSTGNRCSTK